ncbi:hypothetical protein KHA90_15775 [Flavobacterium psychroterrae]|uniref:Uncharacterized protein n=1 Tax=Flavobacterium psychroterrae TaxID=2133767 RepID=A0ABS5PF03_9FLAO|nr:hypothetical protein [Flavobacterium psychroterrae]MBS7232478.1 hypothetical protein [Flavobacterium psychroterrae]
MNNEFTKHEARFNSHYPLHKYELNMKIRKFVYVNNLLLPGDFSTHPYSLYQSESPDRGFEYAVIFLARVKTPDDILREQLEYQIKNLES